MSKLFSAFALVCLALSTSANADQSWGLVEMNRTVDQTNFVVNRGCSGTLISTRDRYVLTANHCIAAQYDVIERETIGDDGVVKKEKVRRLRDGTVTQLSFHGPDSVGSVTYKVRVTAVDAERDLALLQVVSNLPNTKATRIACAEPVRGEQVYVVGNPMGTLYSSVNVGIVSSMQRTYGAVEVPTRNNDGDKQPLMQISAGIVGGNSGGAVYNTRGELVGVPVLGHRTNEVLGFAAPLESIKGFLRDNKIDAGLFECSVDR